MYKTYNLPRFVFFAALFLSLSLSSYWRCHYFRCSDNILSIFGERWTEWNGSESGNGSVRFNTAWLELWKRTHSIDLIMWWFLLVLALPSSSLRCALISLIIQRQIFCPSLFSAPHFWSSFREFAHVRVPPSLVRAFNSKLFRNMDPFAIHDCA